jgi:hypothetical protein
MSDVAARTTLADLQVYLADGNLAASVDLLIDETATLAAYPRVALQAIEQVGRAVNEEVKRGAPPDETLRGLGALLALAARVDPRIAAVGAQRLARYKRALIASHTPVVPIERVIRHAALLERFRATANLDGAVAECGVAKGLSFLHLCYEQAEIDPQWRGQGFTVIDSFEGLSEPGPEDRDFGSMGEAERQRVLSMTQAGKFAFAYDVVSTRVWREFPGVEIRKGWIPQVFDGMTERRYRFVHVDVDLYAPTRAAFEYFGPRLVAGGVIVTDDYNWPGGRKAVDEACSQLGFMLQTTDTSLAYAVAPP